MYMFCPKESNLKLSPLLLQPLLLLLLLIQPPPPPPPPPPLLLLLLFVSQHRHGGCMYTRGFTIFTSARQSRVHAQNRSLLIIGNVRMNVTPYVFIAFWMSTIFHLGLERGNKLGSTTLNDSPVTVTIVWQFFLAWWRHQMETFSALLAICAGNSPGNSSHKGQWRGALVFSLICVWINGWVNNGEAGDLRRNHAHYDVIVMAERILYWDV